MVWLVAAWYGNLTLQSSSQIVSLVRTATKISLWSGIILPSRCFINSPSLDRHRKFSLTRPMSCTGSATTSRKEKRGPQTQAEPLQALIFANRHKSACNRYSTCTGSDEPISEEYMTRTLNSPQCVIGWLPKGGRDIGKKGGRDQASERELVHACKEDEAVCVLRCPRVRFFCWSGYGRQ